MKRNTLKELATRLKIRKSPTIDVLTKQVILHTFDQMQIKADAKSQCIREHVGASILEIDLSDELIEHHSAVNGPTTKQECKREWNSHTKSIACNCGHAESRVVIKYLKSFIGKPRYLPPNNVRVVLISTHTLCINCANIVIDSGLIDVVAYDRPYNMFSGGTGFKKLEASLDIRLWTKEMIEADVENNYIRSWLTRNK